MPPTSRIRGIHHVALSTPDLARSLAFYRDRLGFPEVTRFDWAGSEVVDRIMGLERSAGRAAFLDAGNVLLEFFQFASPAPAGLDPNRPVCDHGLTHLCLDVTDVDALYEPLLAAGVRFHCPPQDEILESGGVVLENRLTYGRDPDGNVVELLQIPGPASVIWLDAREERSSGLPIRGVNHLGISTPDLERSLTFYRDRLGFPEVTRFDWAGSEVVDRIMGLERSAGRAAFLDAGNVLLEFFEFASPAPAELDPDRPVCDHGLTHLCLDVTDVDALYEPLLAAGVRFHCPPQDEILESGGVVLENRLTYSRDPDGNVVELLRIPGPESAIWLEIPGR